MKITFVKVSYEHFYYIFEEWNENTDKFDFSYDYAYLKTTHNYNFDYSLNTKKFGESHQSDTSLHYFQATVGISQECTVTVDVPLWWVSVAFIMHGVNKQIYNVNFKLTGQTRTRNSSASSATSNALDPKAGSFLQRISSRFSKR